MELNEYTKLLKKDMKDYEDRKTLPAYNDDRAYLKLIYYYAALRDVESLKTIKEIFDSYEVVTVDETGINPPIINLLKIPRSITNKIRYMASQVSVKLGKQQYREILTASLMPKVDELVEELDERLGK